jgi:decaprenyl-phosphate phosphoribosyltransferase
VSASDRSGLRGTIARDHDRPSGTLGAMSLAPERADASASAPQPSLAMALLRTARPKQWVKNVLVFAAPLAAGVLTEAGPLARTLVAFVALCFAASGTYFLNDALDVEADRQHPTKRNRPIAAGHLSVGAAKVWAGVLIAIGIGISIPVTHGELAAVVAGYALLTISYSIWLKHEPVIDLAAVAAGFVLRAIAGGVAADVFISDWFLIVAASGSLFMITGKRHAELVDVGDSGTTRRTLLEYTTSYLGFVRAVAASVMVTSYCLWAFENASTTGDDTWFRLSIVPFVLAVLRYAFLIEQGKGGAPEEIVLSDRVLQILGFLWVLAFAIGINV